MFLRATATRSPTTAMPRTRATLRNIPAGREHVAAAYECKEAGEPPDHPFGFRCTRGPPLVLPRRHSVWRDGASAGHQQSVPLPRGAQAMAAPWPPSPRVLLLVAALCLLVPLSHGRTLVPGLALPIAEVYASQPQRNARFNGVVTSDYTLGAQAHGVIAPPVTGDDKIAPPGVGTITRSRTGDTDSHRQYGDGSISTFEGKKWRMLSKVAEWVLHTCVVLLVAFAIFYSVSCFCACCIGLDLLAEIWRSLGGCHALRALLSYFVSTEKAVVEGNAGPLLA